MSDLKYLSNGLLIQSYKKAIDLNLRTDIVMLFVSEMKNRGIKKVEG